MSGAAEEEEDEEGGIVVVNQNIFLCSRNGEETPAKEDSYDSPGNGKSDNIVTKICALLSIRFYGVHIGFQLGFKFGFGEFHAVCRVCCVTVHLAAAGVGGKKCGKWNVAPREIYKKDE